MSRDENVPTPHELLAIIKLQRGQLAQRAHGALRVAQAAMSRPEANAYTLMNSQDLFAMSERAVLELLDVLAVQASMTRDLLEDNAAARLGRRDLADEVLDAVRAIAAAVDTMRMFNADSVQARRLCRLLLERLEGVRNA